MSLNKSVLIDISTGPNKKQMTKDDKSERHTHTHKKIMENEMPKKTKPRSLSWKN